MQPTNKKWDVFICHVLSAQVEEAERLVRAFKPRKPPEEDGFDPQ
jgi:hypothetical protein